ncbi:spore coat polysaccharide biosynthesis protein SpsF [Clostridium acetobutylicum]|uniref:Spore coat polysaccharide biosynthesis protein F n=1 Tax=Clostridium acetobutylicum (strain ATCC 824 / DSM 792 / JCM 1419 / IAM 19013 / LMG 5710 / NBRC 13948 / NRRL B-527 / VKM B-1787 / 2291 / W) TaxID=272562 RepID=Q97H23_CLOAB|nr:MULTISPECIES: NTP transferase domain-containing protein [Clostridium]AAK80148.1 Spore coat polysaccharide biosynthesis protein F [Clostridium acetobutylicum ATCC 824]ADZ21241.1 Spore coat polysaccharide biosynthesis protein F [Clostridium acetobutylicum EA 2018]AEI33065.1 spore coat polysaccharide biosynthesis protein F [Clostridium acetobutylicum DSM 1731]AWV79427.1 3-deoxy-manno-octulosonate cytidylyltransferase [Clostridium acetobutylicum]KHD38333.1 3-deoxy-manno-octulosonate cytidylyltr
MGKIFCIVQARMGSERLQGKVIKPILKKPMVIYTLDRLKKSKYIDKIVLATSSMERETPLVESCEEYGYDVFKGSEANVLKRYEQAAEKYGANIEDAVIRVTGDCPLIDPIIVDNVVTKFLSSDYDYVRLDVPNTFVRGFDVEIFSMKALKTVNSLINGGKIPKEEADMYKEHVTLYMYKHPNEFKVGYVKGDEFYSKDYRLCVDTKEDFELVKNIYEHFNDEFVSSKNVINYLDRNSEIAQINNDIKQKEV